MSGLMKDPKIKLFGKTIELSDTSAAGEAIGPLHSSQQEPPCSSASMREDCSSDGDKDGESNKNLSDLNEGHEKDEDQSQPLSSNDDSKAPNSPSKPEEEEQSEAGDSRDKTALKKPDKILPCPRCNSMDTKFCYFNNYNVNQPRHFCKNCQRYWTSGGSMRNMPVGAGRRKNKSTSSPSSLLSQFRQFAVPEALNHNGTVLTFGSDARLCESMDSVLSIADRNAKHGSRNGFHRPEGLVDRAAQQSSSNGDAGRPESTRLVQHCQPFGASWPYPWNPIQWNSSASTFPIPYYSTPPPPYWGWSLPWMVSPPSSSSLGPNSPTLGKHSRDEVCLNTDRRAKEEDESVKERGNSEEKSLWAPKALRIDDPQEAAKSSIWATLGIKNDRSSDSINGNGLFKGFQQLKVDERTHACESSNVLQANPAALSRSLRFHESSYSSLL